jgi:hypothetical protein
MVLPTTREITMDLTDEQIATLSLSPHTLFALSKRIEEVWGEFADEEVIELAYAASGALNDLEDRINSGG